MIDLSQWRASIGSWNFCQRSPRSNHSCSIRSANGCRYHLYSTTAEKKEIKLLKIVAFLVVFELVFLGLFLSIHILLHYSPVRLTGIFGGYFSFQYTVISAENWLQLEPICFHDNLLLLLLSGDVELNPGPLEVLNEGDLVDIIDALKKGGFITSEWCRLGLRLRIKNDDLTIIETNYPKDVIRCLEECLVKWLKTGKATYAGLAEALEKMGEKAAADHINTKHHNMEQDTQDQVHVSPGTIDKWLEEGSVELTVTRVTMCGLPGTGKTCAQNLLLNKGALSGESTPIADRTVRATRVSYDNNNWDEVTREAMLSRLKDNLLQKASKLQASATTSKQKAPTSTSENISEHVSEYTNSGFDDNTADSNDIHDDKNITVITEVLKTDLVKGFQEKEEWLYIIDSGGQPAYQELLPLFTRAASLNIITIDLSKPLEEELELKYRIGGKSYPCHSKSTQLACFESVVSSGAIFEPLIIPGVTDTDPEAKQSHSMHMILGTHYNDDNEAVGERERLSCEKRLSEFVSSLKSYLGECVIKTPAKSMIFHVNSLAESSKREKYRKEVCQAIWGYGADASCKFKLPIRWFAFELSLPESRVITEKKAISIGGKYKMEEEDTKCALRYLHHVSLILYYPEVLDVVFTSPQPILKILSQLLALTYVNVDSNLLLTGRLSLSNKEYLLKGFFRENLLKNLKASSEVFSNYFQPSHLIKILHHLNIITPVQGNEKGDYFIPYALPSYTAKGLCIPVKNPSDAKPLHFLYWNKRKDQFLPIPHGVFPLTVVNLLNQKQFNVIIPSEGFYLCRDAMSLSIEMNETYHTLHIVNRHSHIEVYYTGPRNNCAKVRELIIKAIKDSSKAINIACEFIHSAFSCQYRTNCIVTDKGKPKKPCAQTCTFDDDEYCRWFKSAISSGDSQSSTLGSKEASQVHKYSKAKRQASVRDMDETVTEETDYHSKRKHVVNDEHTDDISGQNPKHKTKESHKSLDPDILKKEPKLVDLLKIFHGYEQQYKLIGDSLEVKVTDIGFDAVASKDSLRSVFERWRQKAKDVNWERIMQVCEDFPVAFGKIKSKLEEYLSSVETHEKYLDNHKGSSGDEKLSSEIEILTKKNSSLKEELAKLKEEHRNEQLKSSHDHDENQKLSFEIESLKEKLNMTKKKFRAASQELDMLKEKLKYNKKELDEKRFSFRTKSTFAFLLSTYVVVLIPIVISMLIAAVSNLYSSHTPKHFIAPLPGVEVIKSTDLTVVGGQSRKFDWKEYGLLLDVPSDALPRGFLADITIRVSVSGPYIYPGLENWKPASPVYWISSSREFINPIMFGIRHYVRGEVNSSVIKVVTADDSLQNVSYVFQEIPNNITVSKDYVYFSMSHFSGVEAKTSIKYDNFCGTLLSRDSSKGKNMWDYNFVIYQCSRTIDIKNEIDRQTNSSWSVEKAPISVRFLNGSTELELNLTIDPPMLNWQATGEYEPLRYYKENLRDELINSNMQFTLRWVGNDTSPTVPYDLSFPLKGAEQPEKIKIKTKSIEQPSIWEKYKIIILTLSLILIIIYFCLYYYKKSTAEQPSIWEKCKTIIISLILITICFCADYHIGMISMSALVIIFFNVLKLGDSAFSNFSNLLSTLKSS